MISRGSSKGQRLMLAVLVITLVSLLLTAAVTIPVQAGTTCAGWFDSGRCCDTWWPYEQDLQHRICSTCTSTSCYEFVETRCHTPSKCPD